MLDQNRIEAYFAHQQAELIAAVSQLVAIPSVKGPAQPGMPFGPGPAQALDQALALCRQWGFTTQEIDGYVGTADLNDKPTALHILGHLDVVGAGTGWTVTEPYEPKVVDGMLYGRGSDDDKGPIVAALMAMRAVRALGIPLKRNVKLIMGTDEESGASDIAYYYARHPYAPYSFSPDASFPVINIEKGRYCPTFGGSWSASDAIPRVCTLTGGQRVNVVPSQAVAVVQGLSRGELTPVCARISVQTGAQFDLLEAPGGIQITCSGIGAHAATPEEGNNAITALLALLSALPLADGGSTAAIHALRTLFPHGDTGGGGLGVAQTDELSGSLTLNLALMALDESGVTAQFDSRTPLCATVENCARVVQTNLGRHGMAILDGGQMAPAHHTPAQSKLVQTLLHCYEQYTGQPGYCIAIGGGTYVHDIPGGVAFGCSMPGFESNLHGADEHIKVADLLTSCKIFTQAIIDLCS